MFLETKQPFRLIMHTRLLRIILSSILFTLCLQLLLDTFQAHIGSAANPDQGIIVLNDPLSNNNQGNGWTENKHCQFTNGSYQTSIAELNAAQLCMSNKRTFSNFTFEVQSRIVQGDCGGIAFRWDSSLNEGYIFDVCQDGSYTLYKSNSFRNSLSNVVGGYYPSISTGTGQINLISVTAQGDKLRFYANGQPITSTSDDTYDQGSIGTIAVSNDNATIVSYSNAKVEIPSIAI